MKKFLLLALILFAQFTKAQVVSIVPNNGTYGQTLTTTITLANGTLTMSSPPMGLNDIYLQQGSTYIYATNYTVFPFIPPNFSDSISATFSIPPVTNPGFYDVHVTTYQCAGCPFPTPNDNQLLSGFFLGNVAGHIEGDVYFDANQNGVRDTGEVGIANQHLINSSTNGTAISNLSGHYSFAVDTGVNNISLTIPPIFTQTSTPLTYIVSVPPDTLGNDFGIYAAPASIYTQNFVMYSHDMRCISNGYSGWHITSTSPGVEAGSITVIHSSNLTFNNSTIPPSSTNGDTITWNYTLTPYATLGSQVIYTNPAAGDTVSYIVIDSVFDITGTFQNLYFDTYTFVVSCSVDPNDKSVSPPGEGGQHFTLKNSELSYTIRFQNTGTDTAYNVLVIDTMNSNLDLSTLTILGSSHPVSVQTEANGAVKFRFDNILLADSNIDEPNSHGYVIYRISPISGIVDGTQISNRADIYFDFNSAVLTNTTLNTMVTVIPVGVNEIPRTDLSYVYPNPVSDVSILVVPNSAEMDLRIYDVQGREIIRKNVFGNYLLAKNKLPSGIYYYQLKDKDGSTKFTGKFVVVE